MCMCAGTCCTAQGWEGVLWPGAQRKRGLFVHLPMAPRGVCGCPLLRAGAGSCQIPGSPRPGHGGGNFPSQHTKNFLFLQLFLFLAPSAHPARAAGCSALSPQPLVTPCWEPVPVPSQAAPWSPRPRQGQHGDTQPRSILSPCAHRALPGKEGMLALMLGIQVSANPDKIPLLSNWVGSARPHSHSTALTSLCCGRRPRLSPLLIPVPPNVFPAPSG